MKALILAGGKGARLGNVAKNIPKPMVRIGEIPILEHQVNLLKRYGITRIILLTGHLSEIIEAYFSDGSGFGVEITYYKETKQLGTTGALKEIEEELTEDFLLLYGDVMINLDLDKLIRFHKSKNGIATLALHPNDHPSDSDLVEIDQQLRITSFYSKPHEPNKYYRNLVNAALYVMSPKILGHIEKDVKADFGKDIFPRLVTREKLYGYITAEYLKDVGTPERLKEVSKDCKSGKFARFNIENKRKAIFLDRDGVLNEEVDLLHKIEDMKLLPNVAQAIKLINHSEYLAIVITNQSVVARNLCSIDELEVIHKKLETLLGRERAKVDAIYYCPHHPDKGYPGENPAFKIECECRKPKTGMIKAAEKEYNIDLRNSFFIGDSARDIICGQKVEVTSIAVRTGKGCKENEVLPHYFFDDLMQAVDFIIDEPYYECYKNILAISQKTQKSPFVITIGGNTRSGKSTLSSYLSKKLTESGKTVLRLHLDNWLLPKEERREDDDVYQRFQLQKMQNDLLGFFNGEPVTVDKYNSFLRGSNKEKVKYQLKSQGFVIIEGVVALSSHELRNLSDLKIFCDISDNLLIKRASAFYAWKGLPVAEIGNLLKNREKDEYRLVNKDKVYADVVVGARG